MIEQWQMSLIKLNAFWIRIHCLTQADAGKENIRNLRPCVGQLPHASALDGSSPQIFWDLFFCLEIYPSSSFCGA